MIDCVATVRVRYAETDQMGCVYYSNYFNYFEVARLELLRKYRVPYNEIESRLQCYMPVISAQAIYFQPAHFEEELKIMTKMRLKTRSTIEFFYRVDNENGSVAQGSTQHAFINTKSRKLVRIPHEVLQILRGNQSEYTILEKRKE